MTKTMLYLALGWMFIVCDASARPGDSVLALSVSALLLDTRIESPAANNDVRAVAPGQPGDTIRFQLFAPDEAGVRINGWTVELSLPGRTFDSYVGGVSGTAWTGADLILSDESGRPSLSMLSVSAVAVPSTGYLGEITLTVSRALPLDATLIVRSASLGNVGGQWQLDVSDAVISFDLAECPGDVNHSGRVDFADFLLFVAAFGASTGASNYNALIDLDGSGGIDFADFLLFVPFFGTTCEVPPISGGGGGGTVADRDILVALYNATNGLNWSDRTNWSSDRPLGDWHGVTVDTDRRVTRLNLSGNGLRGELPSDLGNLNNLQRLELNNNGLTGAIPPSLGDLSNLQLLYLHVNGLTGEIPSSLGNLGDLQWLYLYTNRLSGEIPPSLGNLGSLGYLDVHNNGLRGGVPVSLGNLSNLQALSLSENPLTGALPVSLTGLENLTNLYLDETELCAPTDAAFQAWLQGIANTSGVVNCGAGGTVDREALVALYIATDGPNWANKTNWLSTRPHGQWHGVTVNDSGRVTELRLSNNQLNGKIPEELGNLPDLKRLYLNYNPDLSGPLPGSMTALNSLEVLNLSGTQLCAPMTAAYRTWLKGIADTTGVISCGVSDREALVALYNATDGPHWANKTNWLSARPLGEWHGVTVDGIGRVTRLNLYNNRMSGDIPAELGNLTGLEWLYLNNNLLSGDIPAELGRLASLRHLYLHTNQFRGQIPAALGSLAGLERLFLSNNQLSGGIPAELGNLTGLQWLYLDNNADLSGSLPGSMTGMDSLRVLSMSGTKLCAPVDAAFQTWLQGIVTRTGVVNCVETTADYDQDDDGLIEVGSLAQLDAIRWDLDGNGQADNAAAGYAAAFPDAAAAMGCPTAGCIGYELVADLNFDTNNSGGADAGDDYWNNGRGWAPIGSGDGGSHAFMFRATFEGNSHVISGLFINHPGERQVGFFGYLVEDAEIRNLGLEDVSVTSGGRFVGGLAGSITGRSAIISDSHVTGSVSGTLAVGGLAGYILGNIRYSYFSGSVTGTGSNVGGLVGESAGNVKASVAAGSVTGTGTGIGGLVGRNDGGISASYATGSVSATDGGSQAGGLVGSNYGTVSASYAIGPVSGSNSGGFAATNFNGTITASYWDTQTSGQSTSAGGVGKTTSELQSPTGYTGIYATWNLDLDADGTPDDPWNFGSSSQYPVLKRTDAPAILPPVVTQPSDRDALVALYNATDGPNWANKTNWLSDKPTGQWHGVTANASGRVTGLSLGENQLSGQIPAALGSLANLRNLYLYSNQLTGQIPAALGGLANLRNLYLYSNQLTGQIPAELGGLSNLRNLYLKNNRLSGQIPETLGSLANLESLWLDFNQLGGEIPAALGSLANLQQLLLNDNQLSGAIPAALGEPANLGVLSLNGNQLSGQIPPTLGSLANLQNLALNNNRLSGQIPLTLGSLANLRFLRLQDNQLSGQIPSALGSLANLEWFFLGDNRLSGAVPEALGNLTHVERLDLNDNAGLSGPLPGSMTALDSLESLNLSGTVLCAPVDAAFQAWLQGIADKTGVTNCASDYDQDDDGLIEVASLAQLNAIRWDLDGNGQADNAAAGYPAAFPDAAKGMGCPDSGGCTGYELVADLNFDTNNSGSQDEGDAYWNNGQGWAPVGSGEGESQSTRFSARFEGNSHVISGLYIDHPGGQNQLVAAGFFRYLGQNAEIRNLGLGDVSVSNRGGKAGGLAGYNKGTISDSYVTGFVTGSLGTIGGFVGKNEGNVRYSYFSGSITGTGGDIGGLVGRNTGTISTSAATGSVAGTGQAIGGLVGRNGLNISASYAIGSVSGGSDVGGLVGITRGTVNASFAAGAVTGTGANVRGLVGISYDATISNSYWDTETSSQSSSAGGVGKTTSELRSPTGYTGIYAGWNLDVDGDGTPDDPWDFGTSNEYPVLKRTGAPVIPAPVANPNPDRVALVALYNATSGSNWFYNDNWLSVRPIGEWHGVTANDSGQVTGLSLQDNHLIGAIPVDLGNLANLETLDLSDNHLSGQIPSTLGSPASLVHLNLAENQLSGQIPAALGSMSNLQYLSLQNNQLSGQIPATLGNLTNLEQLFLDVNQLSGQIPAALGNLTHLEWLYLNDNPGLSGSLPGSMTGLSSLDVLQLSGTQLCAPSDGAFQAWLQEIATRTGVINCPDYDQDDDGLIEVASLAQLNAIRWDLDGGGQALSAATGYGDAFPDATTGMGCPDSGGCTGYELVTDLNFDTNDSGSADAGDAFWNNGQGWAPIGISYGATFEGNSHAISGLYINNFSGNSIGLFRVLGSDAKIRNLVLQDVSVSGSGNDVGGLVGTNRGTISASYATGSVSGSRNDVGGLVGTNRGTISASYATGSVSGSRNDVGGLVGTNRGTISASYATGSVSGSRGDVGGLVGTNRGTISASYWDTQTSGVSTSGGGEGKTTRELQAPTGYTGIYADWNLDLDGDGTPDDPWDFGTSAQYPVLRGTDR